MAERATRALTAGELREAEWVYGTTVDFARVRIHRGKYAFWQPDDTAMAPDGNVYFPEPIYLSDFSVTARDMSLLIHELAHVWQIQSGVWLKVTRLWQGGVYDYAQLPPDQALRSYTVEQQASIIADWYLLCHRLSPQHGSGAVALYETIIRTAIPAAQAAARQ